MSTTFKVTRIEFPQHTIIAWSNRSKAVVEMPDGRRTQCPVAQARGFFKKLRRDGLRFTTSSSMCGEPPTGTYVEPEINAWRYAH